MQQRNRPLANAMHRSERGTRGGRSSRRWQCRPMYTWEEKRSDQNGGGRRLIRSDASFCASSGWLLKMPVFLRKCSPIAQILIR